MSNLVTVRVTIRNFEATRQEWNELGDEILSVSVQLAEPTTLSNAIAEVQLVDGSLKAKAAFVGALMVYGAVADYKGFKESLAEIAQDSQRLATVLQETIPKIASRKQNVTQQDVRKGKVFVAAREISELVEHLERLKENSNAMSKSELLTEVDKVAKKFRSLRRQLDQEDVALVERYMAEHDLPVPHRRSPFRGESPAIIRPDTTDELRQLIEEAEPPTIHALGPAPIPTETARPRKRRQMYFKRAHVRSTEINPRLF